MEDLSLIFLNPPKLKSTTSSSWWVGCATPFYQNLYPPRATTRFHIRTEIVDMEEREKITVGMSKA